MKFYLSSYEIGNEAEKLKLFATKGKIGYIPNARDFSGANPERKIKRTESDIAALKNFGLEVTRLDLQNYFGKSTVLEKELEQLGAVFVSGGNVFVLRQAMKLSGLDKILEKLRNTDFLYAGYSAAGCVLAPTLEGMDIVDPLDTPYEGQKDIIWEGLGLVDFHFMPHWNSDHHEANDIEKEIKYCEQHNIPYKPIRDGEVLIIE